MGILVEPAASADPPATPPTTSNDGFEAPPTPGRSRLRTLFNAGAIVAVLGLLFSSTTYALDRRSQGRADEREARSELTRIMGEIHALPREYAPLLADEDSAVRIDANSNFSYELVALVGQAERIASAHESILGAADLLSIGNAHLLLLNYPQALVSLDKAEEESLANGDSLVATASRRAIAIAYFGLGELPEGRAAFERAVAMTGIDDVPEAVLRANAQLTRYQWIMQEVSVGQCDAATAQLAELERELVTSVNAPTSPIVSQLQSAVAACV